MTLPIGIEKLRIYPNSLAYSTRALCEARGMDADRTVQDLIIEERALVSTEPQMIAYELGKCGVFAHEVSEGKGLLVLKGIKDYYREYAWS